MYAKSQVHQEPGTPRARYTKNQVCQEPGTELNQQDQFHCHQLPLLLSPTISRISHQLLTRQSCCPFIGDQCGWSLKHPFSQTQLAYWHIAARNLELSILVVILS